MVTTSHGNKKELLTAAGAADGAIKDKSKSTDNFLSRDSGGR